MAKDFRKLKHHVAADRSAWLCGSRQKVSNSCYKLATRWLQVGFCEEDLTRATQTTEASQRFRTLGSTDVARGHRFCTAMP
jgi:hypothetical protein